MIGVSVSGAVTTKLFIYVAPEWGGSRVPGSSALALFRSLNLVINGVGIVP